MIIKFKDISLINNLISKGKDISKILKKVIVINFQKKLQKIKKKFQTWVPNSAPTRSTLFAIFFRKNREFRIQKLEILSFFALMCILHFFYFLNLI
jgi:hypothetical protein